MDDNGLPPLPQEPGSRDQNSEVKDQSLGTVVPEPVVSAPVDNVILPPLPVSGDAVSPAVGGTVNLPSPLVSEGHDNDQVVVKKKSNMKVVAGLMVALFLVGVSIAVSVLFPGFRGDLRQRASYGGPECDADYQCGTGRFCGADGSCHVDATGGDFCANDPCASGYSCNEATDSCDPIITTTATATTSYECQGGTQCNNGREQSCISFRWVDNGNTCGGGTSSGGGGDSCSGSCQSGGQCGTWTREGSECNCLGLHSCNTTGGGECTEPDTQCVDTYMQRCSGGQWYDTQQRCGGTGGQTGSCTQLGTTCVCNTCHRDGFNSTTGYMCNSTGTEFDITRKCDMPDSGTCGTNTNCEIQTCGCLNTGEASAGETGPYHCWVKNGTTGAWIKEIGETIPNKLGCKGSGGATVTASVTSTITATVTGSSSSSGGSSSSSSGGSSSSSSGGTAPLCVETRVYLKKADGTFDAVATPVSQLSSKVSIGNTIRLAIRGNLANFTKGRFIIKKGSTVLETKETTTKNNLPGDPATFEFVYDYTVASGGSYSIEGAVWQ